MGCSAGQPWGTESVEIGERIRGALVGGSGERMREWEVLVVNHGAMCKLRKGF